MEIEIKEVKRNITWFSDIADGTLFTCDNGDLFLKIPLKEVVDEPNHPRLSFSFNAVCLHSKNCEAGEFFFILDGKNVKRVNKITVEVEE